MNTLTFRSILDITQFPRSATRSERIPLRGEVVCDKFSRLVNL